MQVVCKGSKADPPELRTHLTVGTAGPAARPAHSVFQLGTNSLDMLPARFRLLDGDGPTDPFVARERGDIFPLRPGFGIGNKSFAQIGRNAVDYAGGELRRHAFTIHAAA